MKEIRKMKDIEEIKKNWNRKERKNEENGRYIRAQIDFGFGNRVKRFYYYYII